MQRTVTNRIRVLTELGPDDRPRAVVVLAVLLVLAAAGFFVTRATFDRAHASEEAAETPASEAAPDATSEPVRDAPVAEAPTPPAAAIADSTVAEAPRDASAAPAVAPANARVLALTRGRVAYIRCEGVPQRGGPAPCPRDQRVEGVVWTAIDALPRCPALVGQRGAADLRVVFEGGSFSGLGFRDLGGGELDRDAVRGCLEPTLTGLRSELPAARMTASFRFDIE